MSQAGIANLGSIPPPPGSITDLQGQDGVTVPPNGAGIIFVIGAVAAAGTTPFTTTGNAGTSTETWTIQRTQAAAVTAANIVGLAAFNSAEFTVDANGFVSLAGGGLAVDSFAMQTGTSPVVPTAAGLVTFNGAVVAAGTNPVRTDGTGANTMALEVQISQAIAATNAANIGLAAFDSARFTVDANGFVSLNGAGVGETITGDTGGALAPTAGNWNIFGQPANTTQVMETHNITGDFWIENRSWQTQYVVDTSTTVGLQGTYSTIQAALNAAVADGMTFTNFKKIYVRTGIYTENLVIPPGAILVGETISLPTGGVITPLNNTLITGNHTFTGNAVCAFNNIVFTTAAGDMFAPGAAAICLLYFDNCLLINAGGGALFTTLPSGSYVSMNGCSMGGVGDTLAFNFSATNLTLSNCVFTQPLNISLVEGHLSANNTTGIGFVTLGAASYIKALSCTFLTGGTHDYNIDSTASSSQSILTSCFFEGVPTIAALSARSGGGAWVLQKCATSSPANIDNKLYANNASTISYTVGDQGNLIKSHRTAIDLQMDVNDYYVGITSTAAPRTIKLPDGSGSSLTPQKDQVFIIKDESGGAGTNNITVTTDGGVVLIDGQTSQVINVNYGVFGVIFDGTNYFRLDVNPTIPVVTFPWIDQATGITLASNTGYFVTAATTQTLPAAPVQGTVVKIVADTTGAVVVTGNTGQFIRIGSLISSSAGTLTSTARGDSLDLVFRAATSTWFSIANNGVWVVA